MHASTAATDADIDILHKLNRDYVESAATSDVLRFDEILADDFLSSNPDGSLGDRAAFIERIARPYPGSDLEAQDVRIQIIGEFALVRARFSYRKPDGHAGTGRYTDVWARRQGRWLCVSAHFNRF
jgi:ketosteroid isomerase-like protein